MEGFINFFAPVEQIGTAGQPAPAQFRQIVDAGYAAVVNLAMPDSDNAIGEEGAIVTSLGMTYVHIPVPFDRPTPAHLRQYFGVLDALLPAKVFVHCAVNARVSAFTHRYLTLKQGLDSAAVTSPLLAQWLPRMEAPWREIMALDLADIEAPSGRTIEPGGPEKV